MSSSTNENRDLRKQIGCMTNIFHHFITGRRITSHNHKRLLLAAQDQPEPQHATKTFTENGLEPQKEKPRTSVESSSASFSSSCSSTFSSHDSHRTAQPEKSPIQMNTIKEEAQSHDFRDLVKDSMHIQNRALSIKSVANGERKSQPMKHVDSPMPSKPKVNGRVLVKDERLSLPRFSYDGRESRETLKLKEIPRLSLDSKSRSMKSSESNFLRRDPLVENGNSNQEPESRPRSSVVARLMGLENFPETISTNERTPRISPCIEEGFRTRSSIASEKSDKNVENNVGSPSPLSNKANSVKKLSQLTKLATFPTEPAPWRQKDSKQMAPKNVQPLSSSVYGEIEKRIMQLEFRKSGKDLRALKQILEAMQKTRERMENQTGEESAEFVLQTKLGSSIVVMKPAKGKVSSSMKVPATEIPNLQKIRIWDQKKDSVRGQEAKDVTPRKNNLKKQSQHLPATEKKISSRNFELERNSRASQRVKVENCSTTIRNIGAMSPRPRKSDSERVKRHSSKKLEEKSSQSRKQKVKAKDLQLNDEQLNELSSDTRYSSYQSDTVSIKSESNYSLMETEAYSNSRNDGQQNFLSTSKEYMSSVELAVAITEQPSPVSVLNAAFYNEDSPSPVKKISTSTAFQDENPSPDEAEWHLENQNHLTGCKRSNNAYEFNQKLDYRKNLLSEFIEPGETATTHSDEKLNPDNSYINMIFQSLGLLKDGSLLSADFHVLEQIWSIAEGANKELTEEDYQKKLNQKRERKIVFDTVNEILCHKITSGRLFTMARKRTSPHGLLKEIHSEVTCLQTMPECNDDKDDGFTRLLTADFMHQSEDWADYTGEVPSLVLDIERLIFKDLINEVVTGNYRHH